MKDEKRFQKMWENITISVYEPINKRNQINCYSEYRSILSKIISWLSVSLKTGFVVYYRQTGN